MSKFFPLKIIFSSFMLLALGFLLPFAAEPIYAYDIDISADSLEYDQNCGIISAKGNVELVWEGKTVKADYAEFLSKEKIMNAYGNVKVEENGSAVYAKSISYSYDEQTGDIKETLAASSMLFIRSDLMEGIKKDSYAVHNVQIALCDLDEPHTYFKARKGKLILGERITIYNAVLYVGKVPVFYLPIITKSLKGGKNLSSKFSYNFEPGYTSEGGFSLKNMLGYQFSETFSGRAMIDYYGARGMGYGLELNYYAKNANASVYAYNTNDLYAGTERWTVRPNYNHRIGKWNIRSHGEFISDNSFNNYYNQSDWNRTMNTLNSYFSLTRQTSLGNLLIVAQRIDASDENGDFYTQSMSLPQISYSLYPKKLFGITNGLTFNYKNNYAQHSPQYNPEKFFYKNTATLNYTAAKDFRFGKRFTLKPSLSLIEEYNDKDNFENIINTFHTKYQGTLNSRLRVNRWMDWNVNYSLTARAAQNSFLIDTAAQDYGIETNYLSFTNYMYIGDRTTVRNFLSYNFVNNRLYPLKCENRLSPLSTEIIYTPKYYITVYLKQGQLLNPLRFQSAQLDIKVGETEKAYLNFGAFYQYYDEETNPSMYYRSKELDNTLGFGVWITPKWRLDYSIRLTSRIDKIYTKMNDHEFKIYRDLHCYNLGVTWRIRGIYHEAFFKFDLKTNMPFDRTNQDKQNAEEQIFYPWR
ncbi:MAG: hypothetical protein LBU09_03685 [Endomicrobium sp.]|jgi:LPS-assembly protein|nr:hypothetical protein [Endomicrobium sp.]